MRAQTNTGPQKSAFENNNIEAGALTAQFETDWQSISSGLRRDLGAQIYGQWIRSITLGDFCDLTGTLELILPSEFSASWVADHYADRLSLAWKSTNKAVRQLKIRTRPGSVRVEKLPDDSNAAKLTAISSSPVRATLDPRMTFANFVKGQTNILALSAAERVAAADKPLFNPLYLQAATGQGKTHLMHAIGHAYADINPTAQILYMSAEKFMMEFVTAMRAKQVMDFKARLRAVDVLLIDDIQFIIGKVSTQEEFLHTIDAIIGAGKRLVVAADRAPQALDGVDQRILSRLSMGLVADIQPADLELRRTILEQRLAQMPGTILGEDVIEFLARTISRNVRELEGGLNKLLAYAQLTGRPITRALAEEQLKDILSACRRRITIDEIQRAVCEYYRIDRSEMSSKRRARAVVRPRQVAMYIAKIMTPRSYPEIGRKFGGRDHSTVIHAVRLVENLRDQDSEMDNDVRTLLRQLEA
ncbi:chromosomal replication initiator protein DnaA [Sphingorhabdus arenilitoris]|uniref:Chromosomal replication initiator protein DnaA n=1 Tax=Sphingorhabdus arenilitoris TaxID=1490041 RepID=A0ABV8RKU8_9SPHN